MEIEPQFDIDLTNENIDEVLDLKQHIFQDFREKFVKLGYLAENNKVAKHLNQFN